MTTLDSIEIGTLTPDQWEVYRSLRLRALQEEGHAFGTPYAEAAKRPPEFWQDRLASIDRHTQWMLFAWNQHTLIGMNGALRDLSTDPHKAIVISVYVAPEYRRMGIGGRLMGTLLTDVLRIPEITRVTLSVNKMQTPAIAHYRRCGFRIAGEVSRVRMGNGMLANEHIMELQW